MGVVPQHLESGPRQNKVGAVMDEQRDVEVENYGTVSPTNDTKDGAGLGTRHIVVLMGEQLKSEKAKGPISACLVQDLPHQGSPELTSRVQQ